MSDVGEKREKPDGGSQPNRKRKKGGGDPRPGAAARREIDNACARGDIDAAFAAFDAAVAAGDPLQPHSCNVMLHLCAGGVHTAEKGVYPENPSPEGANKSPSLNAVPSLTAVFPERANDVFNYMVKHDVQRTEMTYTALARVEAAAGKPRQSLDVALRLESERLRPKLRTFAPALHAFCKLGDINGACEVDEAIARHGIELSENEFAALIAARAENGDWEEGEKTLRRAADAFRVFSDALADACKRFFEAKPGWRVCDSVEVNETSGACEAVVSDNPTKTMQLRAIHLSPKDRALLLAGIGKLSRERESADHFEGFVRWLKRRGPLPFLVDGANAGMYNQNFENSGFNFDQVEKVMRRLRAPAKAARDERVAVQRATIDEKGDEDEKQDTPSRVSDAPPADATEAPVDADTVPAAPPAPSASAGDEKAGVAKAGVATEDGSEDALSSQKPNQKPPPLTDADVLASCEKNAGASVPVVFLHVRRTRGGPANGKRARECLDYWKRNGELFTTPAGSNDDWYWLYAAVASGDDAFLVSNDEMRDHAFQMLPAPALFKKWKERHQVRFHMSKGNGLELYFPPPFSHCAQSAADDTWWMIPKDDGSWLCAVKSDVEGN